MAEEKLDRSLAAAARCCSVLRLLGHMPRLCWLSGLRHPPRQAQGGEGQKSEFNHLFLYVVEYEVIFSWLDLTEFWNRWLCCEFRSAAAVPGQRELAVPLTGLQHRFEMCFSFHHTTGFCTLNGFFRPTASCLQILWLKGGKRLQFSVELQRGACPTLQS